LQRYEPHVSVTSISAHQPIQKWQEIDAYKVKQLYVAEGQEFAKIYRSPVQFFK
jgi:hypothetical protein